jgi:hypothetical protein
MLMADLNIDPALRGDDATQNQPPDQPRMTQRDAENVEVGSEGEATDGTRKRQRTQDPQKPALNLEKCKQCRDARKKVSKSTLLLG